MRASNAKKKERKKDDYYLKQLCLLHKEMSRNMIWCIWFLTLCAAFVFDLVPYPYIGFFAKVFDYDLSNLVSILTLVWTFAITIIGYWLDKEEKRVYGVKMIQLLVLEHGVAKIIAFMGIILLELLVLIVVAVAEWEITAVVLALFLVHTVIYAFLAFVVVSLERNVHKLIQKELRFFWRAENQEKKYRKGIICKALNGMKNSQELSEEEFLQILKLVSRSAVKNLQNSLDVRRKIYQGSKIIVDEILKLHWKSERIYIFLKNWMDRKETPLEIKLAIVASYMDNISKDSYKMIEKLLATEKEHFYELYVWIMVYCFKCMSSQGRGWQKLYVVWLKNRFGFRWSKTDRKNALEYWKLIHSEEVSEFASLLNFMKGL